MSEWDVLTFWGMRRSDAPLEEPPIETLWSALARQPLFAGGIPSAAQTSGDAPDCETWALVIDPAVVDPYCPDPLSWSHIPWKSDVDVEVTLHLQTPHPPFDVFNVNLDARLAHALGGAAVRDVLLTLSRAWALSHGRSHFGPWGMAGEAVWPVTETWDGRFQGIGWFQYFGPEWPPTWGAAMSTPPVSDWVQREPNGAAVIVLGPNPLDHRYEAEVALEAALDPEGDLDEEGDIDPE
jgi:hypothetical protein